MSLTVANVTKLNAASGTNVSGNLSAAPQAGSLLLVAFSSFANVSEYDTVSSSPGNTWDKISRDTSGNCAQSWFYCRNVNTAGTFSVTCTRGKGDSNQGLVAIVAEVRGADVDNPLGERDYDAFANGATTNPFTNYLTNSYPNSIFFTFINHASSANPATTTMDEPGWTTDATNAAETNGSVYEPCQLYWQVVAGSAAKRGLWTIDATGATNTCWGIATFKAADTAVPQAIPTVTAAF